MTFYVEIEDERDLGIDYYKVLLDVANTVLDLEDCPYEATLNLTITNDENIRELNNEFRGIDKATDVLSFPMNDYSKPGDFSELDDNFDAFDPESGELILGDIVISIDHVISQANEYGHTILREIAFLIAHSVLHLLGYDHLSPEEETIMFAKQEKILNILKIYRGNENA